MTTTPEPMTPDVAAALARIRSARYAVEDRAVFDADVRLVAQALADLESRSALRLEAMVHTNTLDAELIASLRAQLADARAALGKYGDHLGHCPVYPIPDGCTCGLVSLLPPPDPTPDPRPRAGMEE